MMAEQGGNMLLHKPVLDLQLLFLYSVKTVQFNKFVTCTHRDGNNQIQSCDVTYRGAVQDVWGVFLGYWLLGGWNTPHVLYSCSVS